jgi:MoaA/NifB/PqqE/SkfB family radical SAM enzyme
MGFPKPWPTEWPEPYPYPPYDPPDEKGKPEEERKKKKNVPPEEIPFPFPIPEFRRRFCSVTWAVNHACNLHCTHCYDVVPYQRHDLGTAEALAVIDRLHAARVTFIAFSGGEAFLRKDLFELMAHCRCQGMDFGARSNGTRITPEVARRLKELGIAVVGVSFDGASPATHDAVRGPGGFQAALAGLQALRTEGIRAQMEVVLSRQNAHEVLTFIELGEAAGASEVNFSAMTPNGRGRQRLEDLLDYPLWQQLTQTLRAASRQASIPITPNCAFLGACCVNIEPHVTCDGWLTPCYLSPVKLFNVLDTPAEAIRERLEQDRLNYQDVCGRRQWTQANSPGLAPYIVLEVENSSERV